MSTRLTITRRSRALSIPLALLFASGTAYGAHPLITEDTGTQGAGKTQIEFTSEFVRERDGTKVDGTQLAVVFTRGITDTLDLALTLPWQRLRTHAAGGVATENGLSDVEVTAKWRFFEQGDVSLALKPGLSFPSGDEQRGLGSGRTGASLYLVTSFQPAPWAYHVHAGWRQHRNDLGEHEGIWHFSAAVTRDISPWKLVADFSADRNPAPGTERHPAFVVVGAIYSVRKDLDLDLGYKAGLTVPATDRSLLAGITWRF